MHRVLFNFHRENLPPQALKEKAQAYVEKGMIDPATSDRVVNCILQERGTTTYLNDGVEEVPGDAATGGLSTKLSPAAMKDLLVKRERMMRESKSGEGTITDQFRVYSHIIHCIETGQWLRLMVQVVLFIIIATRLGWVGAFPRSVKCIERKRSPGKRWYWKILRAQRSVPVLPSERQTLQSGCSNSC